MILLLGGTSDTAPLALKLADTGHRVLVSTATETPLAIGAHNKQIQRRTGFLDKTSLISLIHKNDIQFIVDATHPYATKIKEIAKIVAESLKIPYLTYIRPSVVKENDPVIFAENHTQAAQIACSFGKPVLLTTGSRNLEPYVIEAKRTGVYLVSRVLSSAESVKACRKAGIEDKFIVTGRGPFSLERNLADIEKFNVGVMVTKDGGAASGIIAKLEAAKQKQCQVVVIRRPRQISANCFYNYDDLLKNGPPPTTKSSQ